MSELGVLRSAPIIEMVLDVDCDMPANIDLASMEARGREVFAESYPVVKHQRRFAQQFRIEKESVSSSQIDNALQALQFSDEDQQQVVQIRSGGFSFNRLAPYTKLDNYLPEIERAWRQFRELANPVQVRAVRLRYVNRFFLPGNIETVGRFLKVAMPAVDGVVLGGCLSQFRGIDLQTGNGIQTVLAVDEGSGQLAVTFDNVAESRRNAEPDDWTWILSQISLLRGLKNKNFQSMLTDECLTLFR